jgi:Phospholipase_D-nuclease N-terminal
MLAVFISCGVFGAILGLIATVFWFWMIVDCALNPALIGTDKIVWILVVIFLHFIGALIYYLFGRRRVL